MPVQIIINGETAKESLQELSALAAGLGQAPVAGESNQAPSQPLAQQAPVVHQPVTAQSVPTQQQTAPNQPPPVQQAPAAAVPVSSAPAYTLDQLGVAAGPLVDAGRGAELTAWLNQRGASALTQLDKSHYGEFAMYLRSLGAKI